MIGTTTRIAWTLPEDLTEDAWRIAGREMQRTSNTSNWWLGDWWAFGQKRYGARKALTQSPDWQGPKFQRCADCALVARAFETSRRREVLTFEHHREAAKLSDPALADASLEWAIKTGASTRELRAYVKEILMQGVPLSKRHLSRPEAIERVHAWMDASTLTTYQKECLQVALKYDYTCALLVLEGKVKPSKAAETARANYSKKRDEFNAKRNAEVAAKYAAATADNVVPINRAEVDHETTMANGIEALLALMGAIETFERMHLAPVHLFPRLTTEQADRVECQTNAGLRLLKAIHTTWHSLLPERYSHERIAR